MPNKLATVMVVDDTPANLSLMLGALEDQYNVTCVESGMECLEKLEETSPDLILMDVRMPELDGYQTCERIKDDFTFKDVPVIFLSAQTSLEDKLKGYDAGGEDYITKPFDLQEVIAKIACTIEHSKSNQDAISNATSMAFTAMSNIGELGVVIHFMEESFKNTDYQALANTLLTTLKSFNLSCCAQIRGKGLVVNANSSQSECSPLEVELIEKLLGQKRILAFGQRTAFNFDKVTIIVKNMPVEDEALVGRLNDHIASILNGAEARISNIDIELEQQEIIYNRIRQSIHGIDQAIDSIKTKMQNRDIEISNSNQELLDEFQCSFTTLALTEEQENHMLNLINMHMDKIIAHKAINQEIEQQFSHVCESLFNIISVE